MKILLCYLLNFFLSEITWNTIFSWPMYSHTYSSLHKSVYIFSSTLLSHLRIAILASLNTLAVHSRMRFAVLIYLVSGPCPLRAHNWPGTTRWKTRNCHQVLYIPWVPFARPLQPWRNARWLRIGYFSTRLLKKLLLAHFHHMETFIKQLFISMYAQNS